MRQQFADHPLLPWLEYAELRHGLNRADAKQVQALQQRHPGLAFVEPLRQRWLRELARRRDWPGFLRFHQEDRDVDDELRCHALTARLAGGALDMDLQSEIADLYRHGGSRPAACDPAFAALEKAGGLDSALRWERIEHAAEAGNTALLRYVARGLVPADKTLAERYASFIESPSKQAASWPRDARSRRVAALGLARMARRDPGASERLLSDLAPLGIGAEDAAGVRYQVALWSAASYLPDSARRMAAVPASAFDDRLHEWRAREALARSAWDQALAAVLAMPEPQRTDVRWRYVEARLRGLLGEAGASDRQFAALATEPNYHGFLAADRANLPYALCPQEIDDSAARREQIAATPALRRALELKALERHEWAELEWRQALAGLDAEGRRQAVDVALQERWYDRAVFALAGAEDQRYYSLRFPLAQRVTLRRETRRHALDEAWVAALIRAESAWQPHARSHADAHGLMQLLPATAAATARAHGLPWNGVGTLRSPRANIALGTAYLGDMLKRHGGQPYLATAAYNAGPAPIARWLAQRPAHDVDLWVETIPYRETREYVGRIMAFSVVYDWRLHGAAVPLSARMQGQPASRKAFVCPPPRSASPTSPQDTP
jgi:soluble lytic murein transglycosylase